MTHTVFSTLSLLIFMLAFSFHAAAQEVDPSETNCANIVDTGCTSCHYKTRICQVLGKKSKRKWRRSVKNMVRYGASLTDKQIDILTDCLYAAPPGADFICKQPQVSEETP